MTMKVSVITCTWNSEPYLARSIESVLLQNYREIEYIFVDGGSTDGTLDRIKSLSRPYILIEGVRGGISRAMNEGLRVATGEVVAYLHSDDYYLAPNAVSVAKNAIAAGAGWTYGRIVCDVDGRQIPEPYEAPLYSRANLLRRNFIPHPATFVRREWMTRAGGFDESLKYAMDYDLWLRLSRYGDPHELKMPLAAFRVHGGSLSSSNRLAAMEEDFKVRIAHCGSGQWQLLEHKLRYFMRRRRTTKSLKPSGG